MTKDDLKLIFKIIERAAAEGIKHPHDRISFFMDMEAAHENIPLKLEELFQATRQDFVHDVSGIIRHINRGTGTLGDCFVPRYAAWPGLAQAEIKLSHARSTCPLTPEGFAAMDAAKLERDTALAELLDSIRYKLPGK